MKKSVGRLILGIFVAGLVCLEQWVFLRSNECLGAEPGPVVLVGTPLIRSSDSRGIVIMGAGFQSGQEIRILFTTPDGQQSDIGYALKPEPKPDQTGSWFTTWDATSFIKEKLVQAGVYRLSVSDGDYRVIAHTPVFFQPEKDKESKDKK